jgi:hypothetical protein
MNASAVGTDEQWISIQTKLTDYIHPISCFITVGGLTPLKWLVAEQGADNISSKDLFVHEADLYRPYSDPKASVVEIDSPYGWTRISATAACRERKFDLIGVVGQTNCKHLSLR